MLWLSYTYKPENGINNEIILECNDDVDNNNQCESNDDNINGWYYNIVGYCLINSCIDEFWKVVDFLFTNQCIGNNNDAIDYSLCGSSNTKYETCIGNQQWQDFVRIFYFNKSYDDTHVPGFSACTYDWFKFQYCNWKAIPENTTFLNNDSSIKTVDEYIIDTVHGNNNNGCPYERNFNFSAKFYFECTSMDFIFAGANRANYDQLNTHSTFDFYDDLSYDQLYSKDSANGFPGALFKYST